MEVAMADAISVSPVAKIGGRVGEELGIAGNHLGFPVQSLRLRNQRSDCAKAKAKAISIGPEAKTTGSLGEQPGDHRGIHVYNLRLRDQRSGKGVPYGCQGVSIVGIWHQPWALPQPSSCRS